MTQATFEENWTTISQLIEFGEGERDEPPVLSGLKKSGQVLLAQHESRRHVKTWALIFADTLKICKVYIEHPEQVTPGDNPQLATQRALTAFANRMNLLAVNR